MKSSGLTGCANPDPPVMLVMAHINNGKTTPKKIAGKPNGCRRSQFSQPTSHRRRRTALTVAHASPAIPSAAAKEASTLLSLGGAPIGLFDLASARGFQPAGAGHPALDGGPYGTRLPDHLLTAKTAPNEYAKYA